MKFEDFKIFLPKFLSAESEKKLFEELSDFPNSFDQRIYLGPISEPNGLLQGDCVDGLPVFNLPSPSIKYSKALLLSNSCDVDPQNSRLVPIRLTYCPIFSFEKVESALRESHPDATNRINSFLAAVKEQRVSQVLYLPKGHRVEESLVFFDRICSCAPSSEISNETLRKISFRLGNYGFYVLLLKLSIHFCRMRDGVDRTIVE